jgi:precorrin-4 methylase
MKTQPQLLVESKALAKIYIANTISMIESKIVTALAKKETSVYIYISKHEFNLVEPELISAGYNFTFSQGGRATSSKLRIEL